MAVYISLSLAAKYNDRIAFKFDEFATVLRFNSDSVRSLLTNEKLRLLEYEILTKLNFKIGDSSEEKAQQISRGHETLLKVFPATHSKSEVTSQVQAVALFFTQLTLLSKSALVFSTDDVALASGYMALKLYERKSGQSGIITHELFKSILATVSPDQFS